MLKGVEKNPYVTGPFSQAEEIGDTTSQESSKYINVNSLAAMTALLSVGVAGAGFAITLFAKSGDEKVEDEKTVPTVEVKINMEGAERTINVRGDTYDEARRLAQMFYGEDQLEGTTAEILKNTSLSLDLVYPQPRHVWEYFFRDYKGTFRMEDGCEIPADIIREIGLGLAKINVKESAKRLEYLKLVLDDFVSSNPQGFTAADFWTYMEHIRSVIEENNPETALITLDMKDVVAFIEAKRRLASLHGDSKALEQDAAYFYYFGLDSDSDLVADEFLQANLARLDKSEIKEAVNDIVRKIAPTLQSEKFVDELFACWRSLSDDVRLEILRKYHGGDYAKLPFPPQWLVGELRLMHEGIQFDSPKWEEKGEISATISKNLVTRRIWVTPEALEYFKAVTADERPFDYIRVFKRAVEVLYPESETINFEVIDAIAFTTYYEAVRSGQYQAAAQDGQPVAIDPGLAGVLIKFVRQTEDVPSDCRSDLDKQDKWFRVRVDEMAVKLGDIVKRFHIVSEDPVIVFRLAYFVASFYDRYPETPHLGALLELAKDWDGRDFGALLKEYKEKQGMRSYGFAVEAEEVLKGQKEEKDLKPFDKPADTKIPILPYKIEILELKPKPGRMEGAK